MTIRPLRLGMAGGGPGSFIGPVHRMAARLDDRFVLVAGALSRSLEKSREQGARWGIAADRLYATPEAMFSAEKARADGIEAVAITTPNSSHRDIAVAALRAGIAVISDKPMTATLDEAEDLAAVVAQTRVPFALTYTYTGYAMLREGTRAYRRRCHRRGAPRWWPNIRRAGCPKRSRARTRRRPGGPDPALAGAGGAIGDIGVTPSR